MSRIWVKGIDSNIEAKLSDAVRKEDIVRFRNQNPKGSFIVMSLEGKSTPYEVTESYPFCCVLRNSESGKMLDRQWKEVYLRAKGYAYEG